MNESIDISKEGKDLMIGFNPKFLIDALRVIDDEKIDIPEREGRVIIRPYLLPHPSNMTKGELELYGGRDGLRNLQGFYIIF